ncbi:50S ribosomal protein L18 [archaeon]|jgi:large subunit ribosomal protein L18|nr:50S ribosomal protein L18 [archaeon]MDP6548251.1 50S ribosomal protein L18 [Candidatus Woesearchaeota archaeon]|tara:strand:+ start:19237 stop:19773 length:537 start_codon:yes stop_codon:yes gene_type:complete
MKKSNTYTVEFRRKREGNTNYRKRLKILSSNKPRLVVRKSLKNMQAAIVDYDKKGDRIITCSHSSNLKKFGWAHNTGNMPAAYLVGFLLGKRAKNAKIDNAVLDIGLQKSVNGSRIYAVLNGVLDAGLKIPHDEKVLPKKERIAGGHITKYAALLKKDTADIAKKFEEVKNNIDKNGK